ncbi:type III sulfide quinone reductase, selenoprotein subtype [Synoicihabitans lomoniglobus]|uniref:FAD/NAD(P)-binding oxidoreductase n=1 Tax=Synoicihabitans lomoniglobus TaxID=2909285 RepID=A0AAF0CPI5_9BACT|nr:NAD(P)/FAD-dependent oxidoreductase [Opitutaceae bacterium LMO-M01]WED64924.1 FAD/NAD(P)-binding oxidoreductase [Opitutaceae bacterium LMO-M01]
MKKMLILGAGTAGTIMANKLAGALDRDAWQITVVDRDGEHHYQPGYLFVPFGIYSPRDIVKPRRDYLPRGIDVIYSGIDVIDPEKNQVRLTDGRLLGYDYLIIATGAHPEPGETEGLEGEGWRRNVFDFYTLEGATALSRFLKHWEGGRLVINISEMPIKCPVAPLEFAFLADWWFTERGIRNKVEIEYVTPLPGAFTKPKAAELLGDFLDRKNIHLTSEFAIGSVDSAANKIVSWDEREVPYDLLVSVPVNMGDAAIARSGFGDELNFIPTDKHTLRSQVSDNIFVLGDATDLPSSKAGSVAHFQADILFDNMLAAIDERPLPAKFDGHANCFIESGFNKGLLIDFNYDTEPLPGKFPLPGIGPFSLLEETKMNHYGKMMFRWVYWNLLLRGAELPIEAEMTMAGKRR